MHKKTSAYFYRCIENIEPDISIEVTKVQIFPASIFLVLHGNITAELKKIATL